MVLRVLLTLLLFIAAQLKAATLDEKIGQMVMVGFRGKEVDENSRIIEQIRHGEVGGVILYDWDQINKNHERNIESPEQLKRLCHTLKSYAGEPLLIAVDQEGGLVNRLKPAYGFPDTLSAAELGSMSPFKTYEESRKIAYTLYQAGINLNLAPVADLNIHPLNPSVNLKGRSFGSDSVEVSSYLFMFWFGHRDYNIATTLKHFPGIGSADKNTHLEFVDVTDTWSSDELWPFQAMISNLQAMIPSNDGLIMTGHIYNKNLDPDYPASLSEKVVQKLLREEMGFDGVVISDDLQMGAIRHYYSLRESIKLAILSGTDLLLFANNEVYDEGIAPKVVALIKEMVESGEIPKQRIEESYERIRKLGSGQNRT
jgi:beta-N-acetylhexosaminidase